MSSGPMTEYTVPARLLEDLLGGYATGAAAHLVHSLPRTGRTTDFVHPGDGFGRVLAWAWELHPDRAMMLLVDLVAGLRNGPGAETLTSPVTLEQILQGVRYALPPGFADYKQLVTRARTEVPALYGDPTI